MKRSTKLALKTETLRTLTNQDLGSVAGGLYRSGNDCVLGTGSGNENSTDDPNRIIIKQYNVQYGP
jgi:hypothetical protein